MHEEMGGASAVKKYGNPLLGGVVALRLFIAAVFAVHAWLTDPPDSHIIKAGQPILARLMPVGFKTFEMDYDDYRLVCKAKVAADHQAEWAGADAGRLQVSFDVPVDQESFDLRAEQNNGGSWVLEDTDATAERISVKAFEAQIQACLTAFHDQNEQFVKAEKEQSEAVAHNLKSWQTDSAGKS